MSFRENLKQELLYRGMLVKELAAATGVQKRALDTYLLSTNASMPPADVAFKIARALGVSVEYLVTGTDQKTAKTQSPLPPDLRLLVATAEKLNPQDRRLAVKLVKVLGERVDEI